MKKLQYAISINASANKVYQVMLGINHITTYQQWTAEFNPTSTYVGNWEKGSKMLFIGIDENGVRKGMVAQIAENMPNQFVSIRHYGLVEGDIEITEGEAVEKWAGGLENYTFTETDGITTLTIEVDVTEEYIAYFDLTWQKALSKLKAIIEEQ